MEVFYAFERAVSIQTRKKVVYFFRFASGLSWISHAIGKYWLAVGGVLGTVIFSASSGRGGTVGTVNFSARAVGGYCEYCELFGESGRGGTASTVNYLARAVGVRLGGTASTVNFSARMVLRVLRTFPRER